MEPARCSLLSGCLVSGGRRAPPKVCYFGRFCHMRPAQVRLLQFKHVAPSPPRSRHMCSRAHTTAIDQSRHLNPLELTHVPLHDMTTAGAPCALPLDSLSSKLHNSIPFTNKWPRELTSLSLQHSPRHLLVSHRYPSSLSNVGGGRSLSLVGMSSFLLSTAVGGCRSPHHHARECRGPPYCKDDMAKCDLCKA